VDGLFKVLATAFAAMTADILDNTRLAVSKPVALAELSRLDREALVVVASDLGG
jgi:hypothetical protein